MGDEAGGSADSGWEATMQDWERGAWANEVRRREGVWEADGLRLPRGDADTVAATEATGVAATEARGDAYAVAATESPDEAGAWADWLDPDHADAFAATETTREGDAARA